MRHCPSPCRQRSLTGISGSRWWADLTSRVHDLPAPNQSRSVAQGSGRQAGREVGKEQHVDAVLGAESHVPGVHDQATPDPLEGGHGPQSLAPNLGEPPARLGLDGDALPVAQQQEVDLGGSRSVGAQ